MTDRSLPRQLASDERQVALRSLLSVFRTLDPDDCETVDSHLKVIVGYPFMYDLTTEEYNALRRAAATVNADRVFISVIEGYNVDTIANSPLHWQVSLENEPYTAMGQMGWPHICENAIYAASGIWAAKVSSAGHLVVAGPEMFCGVLSSEMDRFGEDNMVQLIRDWPVPATESHWIAPCLTRSLGAGIAQAWMDRARRPR